MKARWFVSNILCLFFTGMCAESVHTDSVYVLTEVEIVEQKSGLSENIHQSAMQIDRLSPRTIEQHHIVQPKDVAEWIPNLSMPDYGSAMTSTIYFRGLGSRLDQPAVGLQIDGVPVMDKNAYDQSLQDIRYMAFRRGPQGTLYGRNTMAGVLEIEYLQPLDMASMRLRSRVEYSTANTVRADVSVLRAETEHAGWSLYGSYGRSDGYYRNAVDGSLLDGHQTASTRASVDVRVGTGWRIQPSLSVDWIRQGAFPYASAQSGVIALSDPSSYERMTVMASCRATYLRAGYQLRLVGSYQYLGDDMRMDQDYTAARIFTLRQRQNQHTGLVDALLTSPAVCSWYRWSLGAFAFVRHNRMSAPVTFLRQGIDELILSNANAGIRQAFPQDSLEISESSLEIRDDFTLINGGVAIYHQSTFTPIEHLQIDLGLRLDAEYAAMHYDAGTMLHYRMTALMATPKRYAVDVVGTDASLFCQVLPRISIRYQWPVATLYASAAKGSKAGGYNPQIFSTIIQHRLMQGMMADMGVHLDGETDRYSRIDITRYRPESAWNTEVGCHIYPQLAHGRLCLDADVFYIRVKDQQVTVFPDGKTTGRMMANASRSYSLGAEITAHYDVAVGRWRMSADGSYGYTRARFVNYADGFGDYSGKAVPYVPEHTMSVSGMLAYRMDKPWLRSLALRVSGSVRGRQYWDEANTLSQDFYGLLSGSMEVEWPYVSLSLWAKNLTGTNYNTFYFVSMSQAFLQRAKPRQLGVSLTFLL